MKTQRTGSAGRPHYIWTEDDLALLGIMSDSDVAERLGVCDDTCYRKRKELGIGASVDGIIDSGYRRNKTRQRLEQIAEQRKAGMKLHQIAKELGVSKQRAHQLVTKARKEGLLDDQEETKRWR